MDSRTGSASDRITEIAPRRSSPDANRKPGQVWICSATSTRCTTRTGRTARSAQQIPAPASTGCSRQKKHVPKWLRPTQSLPTNHHLYAEVLIVTTRYHEVRQCWSSGSLSSSVTFPVLAKHKSNNLRDPASDQGSGRSSQQSTTNHRTGGKPVR